MKFVAYYRVSTKRQGDSGLGLESQKALIERFGEGEIVAEFTDIGSGGSIEGRPALEQAILLCNEKGYTLIVAKADRLSRNLQEALYVVEKRLNKKFVACDCPSVEMLPIVFWVAQREREFISVRTELALKAKKARKARETIPNFDNLPQSEQDKHLQSIIINGRGKGCDTTNATEKSVEAKRTKAIADNFDFKLTAQMMRSNNHSLQSIANYLTAQSQRDYIKSKGTIKARKFYPSTVKNLLQP